MKLFLFLFVLIFGTLSALTAGGVAIAVHFFHADAAAWTDFSTWNTRPVLTGAGLAFASWLGATVLSVTWRFIVNLLGGGGKRERKRTPRPQSNRRTTV